MDNDIKKFKKGTQYVNIVKAVTLDELTTLNEISDDYLNKKCVKFIPASGAATRMFKDIYRYLDDKKDTEFVNRFFNNLENFSFYEDINGYIEFNNIDKNTVEGRTKIIDYIL